MFNLSYMSLAGWVSRCCVPYSPLAPKIGKRDAAAAAALAVSPVSAKSGN